MRRIIRETQVRLHLLKWNRCWEFMTQPAEAEWLSSSSSMMVFTLTQQPAGWRSGGTYDLNPGLLSM